MHDAIDWGTWTAAIVLLDLTLGGAAAASAGRALARGWRPFAAAPLYMIPLSGAVGFLHYAIFGLSPIPLYDIGAALAGLAHTPTASAQRLADDLVGWLAIGVLLLAFAFIGYRWTRRRQMVERYDWLFERAGLWSWREKRLPTAFHD